MEEEEAQEVPYAKQVASRSYGCSLFGCNQLKQIHGQYCCHNHEILSYVLSFGKVAYTVVDGFFDNDIEKNLKLGIALLKSVQNINVGIPWIADLDDEDHVLAEGEDPTSIFQKVPWNLGFIDCGFLDYEVQRSWLFFHPTSLPRFETFEFEGALFRWDRKTRFVQTYLAEGEEPLVIPSSVAYLREEDDDIEEVKMEGIEFWRKGWTLSKHILHNRSLFCLTYKSNEEDTLFRRKRGKLDTKRKESQIQCSSGPPKKKRKETHVKSCSAGKQTTTVGVLPMASGNLKVHKIQETETRWSEMKVWMIDQICNDSGVSQGEALFYLEGFKWDLDVAMEACRNKTLLPVKKTSSLGGLVTEEPTAEPMVISSGRNQILPNSPEQQPHLDNKLINSFREATKATRVDTRDVNQVICFMDELLGFTEVETLMGASSQSQLQASHGSSSSLTAADPTETVSSHKEAREKNVTVAIPGVASSQVEILPNLPEQQPHLDNKLINSFREATKRRLELTQPTLISATGV